MGMKIAKVLVFANVFVSIGLLAWAVSIYTNRLSYFDTTGENATKGQFSQYTDEIKRLSDGVQLAQTSYVRAMDGLISLEQERAFRAAILKILMDEVAKPGNPNAEFRVAPRHTEPELKGLIDVFKYSPNNPFPPATNLRGQPLKGFGRLQQEMTNLLKDEKDKTDQIRKLREDTNKLSIEIFDDATKTGVQSEVFKMKVIFQNLGDEEVYLADAQVNWEEQLRTLKIRKDQLARRLAEFAKGN
ncbi:MAG: hypothetical protein JNK93_14240 [Planctomycetia bacterium]|nr:hypothetical protein [Planctomycetia bacterium]